MLRLPALDLGNPVESDEGPGTRIQQEDCAGRQRVALAAGDGTRVGLLEPSPEAYPVPRPDPEYSVVEQKQRSLSQRRFWTLGTLWQVRA